MRPPSAAKAATSHDEVSRQLTSLGLPDASASFAAHSRQHAAGKRSRTAALFAHACHAS